MSYKESPGVETKRGDAEGKEGKDAGQITPAPSGAPRQGTHGLWKVPEGVTKEQHW